MTECEWECLEALIGPGKYLAQYQGSNIFTESVEFEGNKTRFFRQRRDRSFKVQYLHLKSIRSDEIFLLPTHQTLKTHIENQS